MQGQPGHPSQGLPPVTVQVEAHAGQLFHWASPDTWNLNSCSHKFTTLPSSPRWAAVLKDPEATRHILDDLPGTANRGSSCNQASCLQERTEKETRWQRAQELQAAGSDRESRKNGCRGSRGHKHETRSPRGPLSLFGNHRNQIQDFRQALVPLSHIPSSRPLYLFQQVTQRSQSTVGHKLSTDVTFTGSDTYTEAVTKNKAPLC